MKPILRLCALALSAALLLPPAAMAASYPDLSADHWAYGDMDRAVQLGILYGMEDGRMAPDDTLTWGQYLVMLDRAFYSTEYAALLAGGGAWDQAGYQAARNAGLLREGDFLPLPADDLSRPILRREAAVLLSRVLSEKGEGGGQPAGQGVSFADWDTLEPSYQEAVKLLSALSIVRGREDGTFSGGETIRRADGSVLLLRTIDALDAPALTPDDPPPPEEGADDPDPFFPEDDPLRFQGENVQKYVLLFGAEDQRRFPDQATAAAAMTTITIPVWHLDSAGNKVPSSASLVIHAAIAEDVKALFTEIYNDPEQFPIHDIGGYSWRGDSATGEHNCGTAIDINSNENYQVREGNALAGSFWMPGENPHSISPDGSVVRIFAQHGWSWGGDAWAVDSDQSYGYHDYMHFSYMGM